jgi:glutamate carboxypeptidase
MRGLNEHEIAAIAVARAQPMLQQVEQWSAVNSGTRNLGGLAEVAEMLIAAFGELPGKTALVEGDTAENVGSDGSVTVLAHGRHLHLRVRPDAPVQLLLTGHMDTVYPVDHAFQSLTMRDDGSLNGPGVADMKGGLAVMLAALIAVESSPLAARIGYDVVINSDEETGSFSSSALIRHCAQGKIAALTYEPALPDGTLAGARGGTGNFSIVVTGRSAHAGRNPEEGRNAIVAAADLAVRLHAARGAGLAVNPARIEGGGPNNVIPDHAVLRLNFRPADHAAIARAQALLDTTIAAVAAHHDVTIGLHGSFNRPPKPIDEGAARLFDLVKACGADLGLDIGWRATGGVCDGNTIAACGIPVVDTMGARGGAIHSPDEYLIVDSLPERAALSALTILRIAEKGQL